MTSTTTHPDHPRDQSCKHAALRYVHPASLTPYGNNARTHSEAQIKQIEESIKRFGFTNPVLVSDDGEIIAGHGRVRAASALGLSEVPTLALSHLTEAERRAYVIADNKLAENAGWDAEILSIELQALNEIDFDLALTGFSLGEIEVVLDGAGQAQPDPALNKVDEPAPGPAVTRRGDLWHLGAHRLLCGDASAASEMAQLMGEDRAALIFTDPPYNVKIDGNVTGLGRQKHREFAVASGEMSREAFTAFLTSTLSNMASVAADGAIAYVCMDWRHMQELLVAGETALTELKNLCVWNKTNAGMGTFYRSKHELVFVFKTGTAAHINSFGLGESGRYRTNVWDYAGANVLGAARDEALGMHPTVKPVELIVDALKDCSRRGSIVLDGFGGAGSTLIAAESCGRKARLLEIDPHYCDTIIRRYIALTADRDVRNADGERFCDQAAEARGKDQSA
ncbi:DNA methyltransferase [Cognatiyoonia sp. IB215182]|uniref:site-specific DNA-methyltransferase n=1 Tax=Cognatiyoonia sp. IB215182 TaxID=3097353 RepID=UPI002A0FB144|nr:DNA methyltransferase [Cognatiyoonia sp. IB215182]MDX8354523.1 DNA methyltransferase [Cognatiyoonia sp. IB215182]